MNFNNISEIQEQGFAGFKTVKELWHDNSCIPKERGVYLVINPAYQKPQFLEIGVGGFFKGKDPNVSVHELRNNIVKESRIVYIGKAGSLDGKATLNSRLGQYLKFGQGKNIGHWGGRYIWQLKNHDELIFCWKTVPNNDPRLIEKNMIDDYTKQFGNMPFANLMR